MAYVNQDVEIYAGDTKTIDLTIYDEDGELLDLSGYAVFYYAYGSPGNPVITKTSDEGIDILTNGKCTISIEPSDTKNLYGKYAHEVDILKGSEVYTVMTGELTVKSSIVSEVE
jgi:hypothetical protein